MIRRLRTFLLIAIAAVLGAVLGRVALEMRQRMDAGEPPESIDLRRITIRVQDLVPGLVAAMRVRDVPWSWLHIPSWLAAFGVNLGVAAFGGDLSRMREMVERAAMGMAGITPGWDGRSTDTPAWEPPAWTTPDIAADPAPRWAAEVPSDDPGQPSGGFSAFDR
ncbi:MAG: hypothetical protein O2798_08860 [Chloroflexi bacterium]|nr:hypothetical protein [Chloroflexota bacterium]MDA1240935.1 hypothetical protein [Chloroflexota bacterium]